MGDAPSVTNNFELQNICAGLGLQPSLEEIEKALSENDGKVDFEGLLRFVTYMKTKFHTPDPPDMDTVRAFVAVGGSLDKSGNVEADMLLQTCKHFDLDIHLEGLLDGSDKVADDSHDVDSERRASGISRDRTSMQDATDVAEARCFAYKDFSNMFDITQSEHEISGIDDSDEDRSYSHSGSPRLNLGHDYQQLLAREMKEKGLPVPRVRRPTDLLGKRLSLPGAPERRRSLRRGSRVSTVGLPQVNQHPERMKHFAELRAKGIPHELYGGEEVVPIPPDDPQGKTGMSDLRSGAKGKGKKKSLPSGAKAHNSPQTILGAGTRVIGRSGLFVDDPPKLYPQHLAATSLPPLPPTRAATAGRASRQYTGRTLLSGIEKRIQEQSKRKLGAKYNKVQARVNVSGSCNSTRALEITA